MVKNISVLSFLIVLIPLIALLLCSGGFNIEMFSTLIGEELKQDFKQKLNSLKYFNPKNVDSDEMMGTEQIHADEVKDEPENRIEQNFVAPFQIETFGDDSNWKNLRFYHDQNVRPYLIGTNPIHAKEIDENGEEIIEGFSLMDMFRKPNNDMKLDDLSIPHGDDITKSLKNMKMMPPVKNSRTLSNGMPTGTSQSNLEAQFLNKLTKTTENAVLNKALEKQAIANSQKSIPIINAKPQSIVKNVPDKSDFQSKFECQFFNGKCPAGWSSNGSFTLSGLGSGINVTCGGDSSSNVKSVTTKSCKCVAEVVDKKVKRIHVTDPGSGYSVDDTPEIVIKSRNGKGSGALAEAIVDDTGRVQVVTVLDGGSGYTETPIVEIVKSNSNQQINQCCRKNFL